MKYAGVLFMLCLVVMACQHSKKQETVATEEEEVVSPFSEEDTTEVVKLVTEYLDYLKRQEFDSALQMLHHLQNDSVSDLSEKEMSDLKQQYKTFPVLSYTIDGITLNDEQDTEVKYSIEFFKRVSGQEDIPNTMNFCLNPQKIDGVWHLGVLNR